MHPDLKLYVRGFFGSAAMSTESAHQQHTGGLRSIFDLNPKALKHVVSNESVVEIYNQLIRRSVILTDFDFREKVIKIALTAFGYSNLATWALAQRSSPTLTQNHADFIVDTLKFIQTGKRMYPIGTWEQLIGAGSNDPLTETKLDHNVLQQFESSWSYLHNHQTGNTLPDTIAQWISQTGGFSDLIITLYTLFGENNTR